MQEIQAAFQNVVAFCETRLPASPPFPTRHGFEDERDQYEWASWFGGARRRIRDIVEAHECVSMNDTGVLETLAAYAPDVTLVFGTGVLDPSVISVKPNGIWNLHGGDPEHYRGLDTHLWAIYHRDFSALVTTLHRLDSGVDTGDIILQESVPLKSGMPIYALRRANTEVCVRLATSAIDMLGAGELTARRQDGRGRYYSSMPAVLKGLCRDRFEAHTSRLGDDSG